MVSNKKGQNENDAKQVSINSLAFYDLTN